ncbi:cystathionine gamma-synthase [Micrococcus lylae]|uniref:Cystathionine gamma-synthase n=1 Tax=Micrococcus lylae TaxID=1273 RepID=A0ABY2JXK2_9MICC|nr:MULTISPECIES: cystathionine gamma-synthase [Micrococcus]MCT2007667.1 cystathionine gamma-synthase [Micrococcus lylae]MCT2071945.1 cystathionine gamma-synthase [Micrococcus lylae]OFR91143.1 cystathionine gamma-synthase [Micrococcus sp. HMSC067E09]PNL18524.1 cystathionine gamma-synthase [Micrococcus sp. FDAARGOS_333]TFH98178.1 cystathionine gamma-synthase [Micrococcus lylae]
MSENTQKDSAREQGFGTRAVHAGQHLDEVFGAVVPPVHLSSTYAPVKIGQLRRGYDYGRGTNPTRDALQEQLAALEAGVDEHGAPQATALTFASGLAAETALIMGAAEPGTTIVMGNDVYGGSYRLITKVLAKWGVKHAVVDMGDAATVAAAVDAAKAEGPVLVWLETPSNPMMKVSDIGAIADVAHAAGALLVVDNTFATPYLQTPLALGADVVVHSTTKYIGGHSDVIGGALVIPDAELAERVKFQQFAAGAVNGPWDAYLTTRGLKTLGVRMDRHAANAQAVAEWLEGRPGVERVLYPGLADHPGHELAARQMRGFGGMVSVQFTGGAAAAKQVAESTRLFQLAESLGGIESLMNYPAEMTHASVAGTELAVPDNLVRLSVGIEDAADLIDDLDRAISAL